MDHHALKEYRERNTVSGYVHKKHPEYNVPILITHSIYTDNGPGYEQITRYARECDIPSLYLIQCEDCGMYMDGGRFDGVKHRCYVCSKEHTLRQIFKLMDDKSTA